MVQVIKRRVQDNEQCNHFLYHRRTIIRRGPADMRLLYCDVKGYEQQGNP